MRTPALELHKKIPSTLGVLGGILETRCAFSLAQTVSSLKQPGTALLSLLNCTRRMKALTRGIVQAWDWCYHSLSICAAEELTLSVFLKLKPGLFHMLLKHKFLWKRGHTSVNILPGRDENRKNPHEKRYCCDSYLSMGFSCHKWWTIVINFLCHKRSLHALIFPKTNKECLFSFVLAI